MTLSTGGLVLSWTITNVGTKPLTIRSVGAVFSGSGGKPVSREVNKLLAPSAQATFETPFDKKDVIKVRRLCAWDSADREYRAAVENFEELKKCGTVT